MAHYTPKIEDFTDITAEWRKRWPKDLESFCLKAASNYGMDRYSAEIEYERVWGKDGYRVFDNGLFRVFRMEHRDVWWHLSIRRKQDSARHDWRELQAIKNAICGPQSEAIELYPAEDRLVDEANQFHLFVMKEGRLPVGYDVPIVRFEPEGAGVSQRGEDGVSRVMDHDGVMKLESEVEAADQ